jgi:putative transposase
MWIQQLTEFIANSQNQLEIKRATAVKMLLLGYKHREIMPILDVSSRFLSKWKRVFFQEGTEGLKVKYKGRTGLLNEQPKDWFENFIFSVILSL